MSTSRISNIEPVGAPNIEPIDALNIKSNRRYDWLVDIDMLWSHSVESQTYLLKVADPGFNKGGTF